MGAVKVGNIIKDVIDDMENGVYNFTNPDGSCSRCGGCCSRLLPLSRNEIREIKRYVAKHHIQEQIHIAAPLAEPVAQDLTCPFLDMRNPEMSVCTIYKVRPKICSVFKCDQPPSKVRENRDQFWKDRKPCDMREVFFGEPDQRA